MTYKNLTLITLNNAPHIKADKLEPVEVDSSCVNELKPIIGKAYLKAGGYLRHGICFDDFKKDGVKIPKHLANRIYLHMVDGINKAFLLPEKELSDTTIMLDKLDKLKESKVFEEEYNKQLGIEKSYTIEEIEKAFEKTSICHYDKLEVINNLKK